MVTLPSHHKNNSTAPTKYDILQQILAVIYVKIDCNYSGADFGVKLDSWTVG
jgi:hypothetical protein